MAADEPLIDGIPVEVGYIITFKDERQDCFGRFSLLHRELKQLEIFKRMVELEPASAKAYYILINLRHPQRRDSDLGSMEYRRADIEAILPSLARPGIIKRK